MNSPKTEVSPSAFLMLAILCTSLAHGAAEFNPVNREPRTHSPADADHQLSVIVKLRQDGNGAAFAKLLGNGTDRMAALAKRSGLSLGLKREISDALLAGTIELGDASAAQALERLRADTAVEYVAIDHRRFPHATNPNDTLFANQWYLKNTEVSAVNAIGAWDREIGAVGVVVAVL